MFCLVNIPSFSGYMKVTTLPATPLTAKGGATYKLSAKWNHRQSTCLCVEKREVTLLTMERKILYWTLLLGLFHASCGQCK